MGKNAIRGLESQQSADQAGHLIRDSAEVFGADQVVTSSQGNSLCCEFATSVGGGECHGHLI